MKIGYFSYSVVITAISLLSTDFAIASGGWPISFTGGIDGRPATAVGETFYEAQFPVNYTSGSVMLSANHDGSGNTAVDDVLTIRVTGPDSNVRTFSHDYSTNCAGYITPTPPTDISNLFLRGVNVVHVEMKDHCGVSVGASSFWLFP